MLHSRSPSPTDRADRPITLATLAGLAAAAALGLAGCGDDACGPGGAPQTGLVASSDAVTLEFGGLSGGINNDCPAPDAPEGVISLTIEGRQTGDPLGLITFCIPRPDLLMAGLRTLGLEQSNADIRIVDLSGNANSCMFTIDTSRLPTGQAEATGVCDNGDSPDGFALSIDGALSLRRTCGVNVDTVGVTLRGRVAVGHR
jgi:hypothetical protein